MIEICRPDHISYNIFLLLLSQFNLLTTADCHTTLNTCSSINLVIENDRTSTLITTDVALGRARSIPRVGYARLALELIAQLYHYGKRDRRLY